MAALNSLYHGNAYKLDLLNSAYLILLPKREDASSAGDFRPISLIHSFAKLVTKILANRLGPYLQDLVAANQSAFIRGRSIHDNFMLVQVQHVLTGMMVYLAMAIDFPSWAWEAINKIRKGFLWRGRKEAKGGHCLVSWGRVCRPLRLGGLGISSLPEMCWALRMRWLWLHKTNPSRPWAQLPFHVPNKVRAFFSTVLVSEVGNGANTLF
jgi:hypothetical protein